MKTHHTFIRKTVSLLLVTLLLLSIVSIITAAAADSSAYYRVNGQTTYNVALKTAWDNAVANNGTFGINADYTKTGRLLEVTKNKTVTVELNGHMLSRGLTSEEKEGGVFKVNSGAKLNVYGNTASDKDSAGSYPHYSVRAYTNSGSTGTLTVTGGLIHGGYCSQNAGAVQVEDKATVNLYSLTIAGNRAEDTWYTVGGDGGAINVEGEYSYVNLYKTTIKNNYASDRGGAIAINAENVKISGDAKSTGTYYLSTTENSGTSTVDYNYTKGPGGAVYMGAKTAVVSGLNMKYNRSAEKGGAVYMSTEKNTVKNCNIFYNYGVNGAGVYNNNDRNVLNTVTIYGNNASESGGGVFNEGTALLSLGGRCYIQGNRSSNNIDNLYMDYFNSPKDAYINDTLSRGSQVGIYWASRRSVNRLTYKPGTYKASYYTSDQTGYYFKWYRHDETDDTDKQRHIYRVHESKPLTPDQQAKYYTKSTLGDTGKTYNSEPVIKGIFEFPATANDTADREGVFYYSDGFFSGNAKTYDKHLATMSANLAMAAMYSNKGGTGSSNDYYQDKSNNFRQLMSDIGCKDEDIYINDYNLQKPTRSTIGVGIASKVIGDTPLVIIGVRGAGYESEWASNVTIGSTGEATGFSQAATHAFSELQKYLSVKKIDTTKAKFWISGYSRAGATANLTAKRIVDAYDTNGERTYAYPIEAPKGGVKGGNKEVYYCIHNVVNTNDIVPWVAPGEFGFIRYGVDHFVPGKLSNKNYYTNEFNSFTGGKVDGLSDNLYHIVGDQDYKEQKKLMLKQLDALNEDIVYDDYFKPATIKYFSGVVGSLTKSVFGDDFISESGTKTYYKPQLFIPYFFQALEAWGFNYDNSDSVATTDLNQKDSDGYYKIDIKNGDRIRYNYSSRVAKSSQSFQTAVANLCAMIFSMPSDRLSELMNVTDGLVDRIGVSKLIGIYGTLNPVVGSVAQSDFDSICNDIWTALTVLSTEDEAKGYHSLTEYLTPSELATLKTAFPAILYPLLQCVTYDYKNNNQEVIGTLAYNAGRLIQNHYPEVALAWTRSYDDFYDDEILPVKLSSRLYPSIASVKVTDAEGNVVKTDIPDIDQNNKTVTASAIPVEADAKIHFVPVSSANENVGEAIYYRWVSGTKDKINWHGYYEPFVLGELGSGYDTDGEYKIEVVSTHYDKKYYTTDPKIYTFKLAGQCSFYTPKTFNTSSYGYSYEEKTVNANASIPITVPTPNSGTTLSNYGWEFKKWSVYKVNQDSSEILVDESEYKELFGDAFDTYSSSTTAKNITRENYKFVPVQEVKSANFTAVKNGSDLPGQINVKASGYTFNNSGENDVYWTKADGNFIGTIVFNVPEWVVWSETVTPNWEISDFSKINTPAIQSITQNGREVVVTVSATQKNSENNLTLSDAVTVDAYELNVKSILGEYYYFKADNSDSTTTVKLTAPEIPYVQFVEWPGTNDKNGAPVSSGENTYNNPNTASSAKSLTVAAGAAKYRADYKPVVSEIKLIVDNTPTADSVMTKYTQALVKIKDYWEITGGLSESWPSGEEDNSTIQGGTNGVGGTAGFDKVYKARYTLDLSQLEGKNTAEPSSESSGLAGQFVFAQNNEGLAVEFVIEDKYGNKIDAVPMISDMSATSVSLDVTYPRTGCIKSVDDIYLSVPYGSTAEYIATQLSEIKNTSVTLYNDEVVSADVEWGDVPALSGSMEGEEKAVPGFATYNGETKAFVANVAIDAAPQTAAPTATPGSGSYEGKINVELFAEEGATIHYLKTTNYTVSTVTVTDEDGEHNVEVKTPNFTGVDEQTYSEAITLSDYSNEIFIKAYATKEGMNKSSEVIFDYNLTALELEPITAKPAKIAEDGFKEGYYVTKAPTDSDALKNYTPRYFSDAEGEEEVKYEDVVDPAFVKNSFDIKERLNNDSLVFDISLSEFGLIKQEKYDDSEQTVDVYPTFSAIDLLGVQVRNNSGEENYEASIRFITAVDTRILRDSPKYGYIYTVLDTDKYKLARNQANLLTIENGTYIDCKGTSNNVSGSYGVYTQDKADKDYTDYKYVTGGIYNIPESDQANKVILARFFVYTEDMKDIIYAKYMSVYDGCAVNYKKLVDGPEDEEPMETIPEETEPATPPENSDSGE